MDELRSEQFRVILGDDWTGERNRCRAAGTLLRADADHAVAMGRRIIYIITGDLPGGEN